MPSESPGAASEFLRTAQARQEADEFGKGCCTVGGSTGVTDAVATKRPSKLGAQIYSVRITYRLFNKIMSFGQW